MKQKILIVDDDPEVLTFYNDYLKRRYDVQPALSGQEATEAIQTRGPFAVIVADMNMPEIDGIELFIRAQRLAPDTVRIMITGDADMQRAIEAINKGHIFQFLTKPCPPGLLASAIEAGIKQYLLITAERELLEKTLSGTIKMLTEILAMLEVQTFSQNQRVREYVRAVAEALRLPEIWQMEAAAMLCQIGYVTIPPSILQKLHLDLPLKTNEKMVLERVPEIGWKLLSNIPRLEAVAQIVHYQNKNFDGTGFPYDDAATDKIPIGSRILKVAAELARLESEGIQRARALEQMRKSPAWYDAAIVEAAITVLQAQTAKADKPEGRPVALSELCVGQTLAASIETNDGIKIVGPGSKISPMLLEKLQNFTELAGVKEPIYVED